MTLMFTHCRGATVFGQRHLSHYDPWLFYKYDDG